VSELAAVKMLGGGVGGSNVGAIGMVVEVSKVGLEEVRQGNVVENWTAGRK
jgi:hypothetical protein